jgi:hypothetical protein
MDKVSECILTKLKELLENPTRSNALRVAVLSKALSEICESEHSIIFSERHDMVRAEIEKRKGC